MLFESFFISFSFSHPHPELSRGWMLYNNHCVHAGSSTQAELLSLPICACQPTVISQLLSCLCVQRLLPVRSVPALSPAFSSSSVSAPSRVTKVTETRWRNPECIGRQTMHYSGSVFHARNKHEKHMLPSTKDSASEHLIREGKKKKSFTSRPCDRRSNAVVCSWLG